VENYKPIWERREVWLLQDNGLVEYPERLEGESHEMGKDLRKVRTRCLLSSQSGTGIAPDIAHLAKAGA
jgi:hypothetical protein